MVTFLLTDVVGSTRLWEASPRPMAAAIARHDEIMGAAAAAAGGTLLKSRGEGDATFSVFERATDAARAALDAQRRLAAEPWPQGVELQVRMALHVGEAVERDHDYYGPAVNRVARLRSVADGGEILVSDAVAQVLLDGGDGWVLERVGERSLKDLSRPEIVYRLLGGGDVDEPRLPIATDVPFPGTITVGDLTGRDDVLAELVAVWSAVQAGDAATVLVAGEPGIGKSTLAGALARQAHEDGAVVLHGRCDEGLQVAYQPFAAALRPLVTGSGAQALQTLPSAGELARLVPELGAVLPPPIRADADAERWALFQAVTALLESVTAARPAVLVIDDLHWAAAPTLQLLRHLARAATARLLVIATYRHTDVDRGDDLADLLADLRRDSSVKRVLLGGLDREGVRRLVEARAGQPLGEEARALTDLLHAETAGNPFFVGEVLRHLAETGTIYRSETGEWTSDASVETIGLPESVREVVGRRLGRLSDAAQRVLRVGAVVGPTFSLRLLERIPDAADEPDEVLDALDEAVGAGLLVEERGLYEFAHALIRQTLLDELTSTRRIRLHRRIAEAIEAMGDRSAQLEALAHHFAEAAIDGQAAKAAEYALAAARQARARAAPEQAAALLHRGIEALDSESEVDLTRRADLRLELARVVATMPVSRRQRIIAIIDEAIDDAQAAAAGHQLLLAVALRLRHSTVSERDAENGELLDRATAWLSPDDEVGHVLALATRARWLNQSPAGGLELARRAAEAARRVDDEDVQLVAIGGLVGALFAEPLPDELVTVGDELLAATTGSPDATIRNEAIVARATGLLVGGRAAEYREELEQIRQVAASTRSWYSLYSQHAYEGCLALIEGRWDDADAASFRLLEHGGEDVDSFNVWAAQQAILHLQRGTLDGFRPSMEMAVAAAPRVVAFRAGVAIAHAQAGRLDEARSEVATAMAALPEVARDQLWPVTLAVLGDAASRVADTEACAAVEALLVPYQGLLIASAAATFCYAPADQILGQLALSLGHRAQAVEQLSAALAIAERIGSPPYAAQASLWLGRALVPAEPASAEQALRRALDLGSRLEMAEVVAVAERELAALAGEPSPSSLPR